MPAEELAEKMTPLEALDRYKARFAKTPDDQELLEAYGSLLLDFLCLYEAVPFEQQR